MLYAGIIVRTSSTQGKGLFTTRPITVGEVVWELDVHEQQLTHEELQALPPTERSLAFQSGDRYIICHDGSQYMNHSCDPNTWWASDTQLVAKRPIQPGEEITYDYSTADVSPPWRATWRCKCGSSDCRQRIASDDCLSLEFQAKYHGHLPSWTVTFIAAHH